MKKTGIYSIKNIKTGLIYIGLSTNIDQRFRFHTRRLILKNHKNKHLQNSFNIHGLENFLFEVVELCDEGLLCERERFWINHYQSHKREYGYNKTYGGEFGRLSDEIVKRTADKLRGGTLSQEQKDKISETLSGRPRPYRWRFSEEVEKSIIEDFSTGVGVRKLAVKYECSTSCIYKIMNRRGIKWQKNKERNVSLGEPATIQLGGIH